MKMHMRVTVDDSHGSLLQDLLKYQGRTRAKRIVYLAAIGYLVEQGGLSVSPPNILPTPTSQQHLNSQRDVEGDLRPFAASSEQLAFLNKLSGDM